MWHEAGRVQQRRKVVFVSVTLKLSAQQFPTRSGVRPRLESILEKLQTFRAFIKRTQCNFHWSQNWEVYSYHLSLPAQWH